MSSWLLRPRVLRGLLVAVAGVVILHLSLTLCAAWDLHRTTQDLIAHQRPVTPGQVIPVVRSQYNAALAYTRAMVLVSLDSDAIYSDQNSGTTSPTYRDIIESRYHVALAPPRGTTSIARRRSISDNVDPSTWPNATRADAWRVLNGGDFARIRAALLAGAAQPACAFNLAWDQGLNCRLPMLEPLRDLVKLLCCHALLCQLHGDDAAMRQDFETGLAMALHCRQIPFMIGFMVSTSMEATVLESISIALSHAPLGDMGTVQHQLSTIDDWPQAARDLDTERIVLGDYVFSPAHAPYYGGLAATPMRLFEHATYARILGDASNALAAHEPMPAFSVPRVTVLTRMLMPSLTSLDASVVRAARTRCVALTALALEDWQRMHGSYPAHLSDMVPAQLASDVLDRIPFVQFAGTSASWSLTTSAAAMAGRPERPAEDLSSARPGVAPAPLYHWHSPAVAAAGGTRDHLGL